ncbi:hypothetical protein [Polynucleobacter meluiroseus]|nr:hypothetical protein [Polynucleobacter meluiroseus]
MGLIIELKQLLMGAAMGFLAFLVIGGLTGALALFFYPGPRAVKPSLLRYLVAIFIGFAAAYACSLMGQTTGFFQAGQMLEWLSAVLAACIAGILYAILSK